MKTNSIYKLLLLVPVAMLSSCGLVESIFKTGMWTGIIIVLGIIFLIIFAISRMGGK